MTASWYRLRGGETSPRHARDGGRTSGRRPVRRALATGLVVGVAVGLWLFFAPTKLGGQANYVGTYGISMEPRFHTGDLAIVRTRTSYRVGQVVAYRNLELGRVVLHRIIGRNGDRYIFKGDNNDFVDPDQPTRNELIGQLWVRIPRGGLVLSWLRAPGHATPLVGIVAVLMLTLLGGSAKARGRRKSGAAAAAAVPSHLGVASWIQPLVGTALTAALVCGLALALSFSRPTTRTLTTPGYVQQGAYAYSAAVAPSAVYPSGRLATGQTVFTRLVRQVQLAFSYKFVSALPHTVHGTGGLRLALQSSVGWTVPLPSPPRRALTDGSVELAQTLDIPAIEAELTRYLTRTGLVSDTFTLVATPSIAVDGTVAGQPVHSTFAPTPLTFTIDSATLRPTQAAATGGLPGGAPAADPLHPGEAGMVARIVPRTIRIFGRTPLVATVRRLSLLGLLGAAAAALLALVAALLSRTQDDTSRIQSRYGALLVSLPAPLEAPAGGFVDVAGFADLARIAAYEERPVLCSRDRCGDCFYIVGDGATYRYSTNSCSEATIRSASDRSSAPVTPFGTATQ